MELEDCGKTKMVYFPAKHMDKEREIIMVIKAPKGTLTLYGNNTDKQCEAIKAFMEIHKNE